MAGARLVFLNARRCNLALEGAVSNRRTEGREAGAAKLALGLQVVGDAALFAPSDLAVGPALHRVHP